MVWEENCIIPTRYKHVVADRGRYIFIRYL